MNHHDSLHCSVRLRQGTSRFFNCDLLLDRNRSPENLVRAHDAICHDIRLRVARDEVATRHLGHTGTNYNNDG